MSDLNIIDSQTTIKQNYAAEDIEEFSHPLIFKKKLKLWQKILRLSKDGTESAIIIPFDTYIEPFYNTEDVDTSESTGVFVSSNNTFQLYTDINGNYKSLVSKYICWQRDRNISTVTITVFAEDESGEESTNYDISIYNGNEWIAAKNGYPIIFNDYIGADLDADLDADLGGQYSNTDSEGTIVFQNKLKFKIDRAELSDKVIIKRIILKVTWKTPWQDVLPDPSPGFPTAWGTWGYN